MMSIKARGGIAVVQDPATAIAPEMPRHVIERVAVDHVVHPLELPGLLTRLVATPVGPTTEPDHYIKQLEGAELGQRAEVVCPVCTGVLTEAQPGVFQHFRCHVGHAFTLESLVREQSEELERVLWAAVRALEESAALARRVSQHETGELRQRFAEKATTHARQAESWRSWRAWRAWRSESHCAPGARGDAATRSDARWSNVWGSSCPSTLDAYHEGAPTSCPPRPPS